MRRFFFASGAILCLGLAAWHAWKDQELAASVALLVMFAVFVFCAATTESGSDHEELLDFFGKAIAVAIAAMLSGAGVILWTADAFAFARNNWQFSVATAALILMAWMSTPTART